MITSKERVKTLAGITTTTYDDQIEDQIAIVADLISEFCNNYFIASEKTEIRKHDGVHYSDSPVVYASVKCTVDSTAKTITSTSSAFSEFAEGDDIVIFNSIRNGGFYTLSAVSDNMLTVEEDIKNETSTIDIFLIVYPKALSNIAARMVSWDVFKRSKAEGLDSQSIGTWSGSYKEVSGIGYPSDISKALNSYRIHRSLTGRGERYASYLDGVGCIQW